MKFPFQGFESCVLLCQSIFLLPFQIEIWFFDFWIQSFLIFPEMVARLLIGDNNLSKFWASYQFSRPALKFSSLVTATDLDALDHALTQSEEKEQVIVSVLTTIIMDEANQSEISESAFNICEQAVSRLVGYCPQIPTCQVLLLFYESTLAVDLKAWVFTPKSCFLLRLLGIYSNC